MSVDITTYSAQTAKTQLKDYQARLEPRIRAFFKPLYAQTKPYHEYSLEALQSLDSFVSRGGKRLRGALAIASYEMFGGKEPEVIERAALYLELIHAYVLIIDDIADESSMRRGGPTVHTHLKQFHAKKHLKGDSLHFGESQAVNTALLAHHLAIDQLISLPTDPLRKLAAMGAVNSSFITTIHGQINDIANEAAQINDKRRILEVETWKTAYYSFYSPLSFGAILAGAAESDLEILKRYSLSAGLAFQIIDDIIGMFGNEEVSGKSSMDDLKEGKRTLLVAHALRKGNRRQRSVLQKALGNPDLTHDEHRMVKEIIIETGALEQSRKQARSHIEEARSSLDSDTSHWGKSQRGFLLGLLDFILTRDV